MRPSSSRQLARAAAGSRHAWRLIVAELIPWKERYWVCRPKSVRFRMPQGWTALRISFFSWWNKEDKDRVLIFLILGNPYNFGCRNIFSSRHGLFIGTTNPFGVRSAIRTSKDWTWESTAIIRRAASKCGTPEARVPARASNGSPVTRSPKRSQSVCVPWWRQTLLGGDFWKWSDARSSSRPGIGFNVPSRTVPCFG